MSFCRSGGGPPAAAIFIFSDDLRSVSAIATVKRVPAGPHGPLCMAFTCVTAACIVLSFAVLSSCEFEGDNRPRRADFARGKKGNC